jgi:hypothetical protein
VAAVPIASQTKIIIKYNSVSYIALWSSDEDYSATCSNISEIFFSVVFCLRIVVCACTREQCNLISIHRCILRAESSGKKVRSSQEWSEEAKN